MLITNDDDILYIPRYNIICVILLLIYYILNLHRQHNLHMRAISIYIVYLIFKQFPNYIIFDDIYLFLIAIQLCSLRIEKPMLI